MPFDGPAQGPVCKWGGAVFCVVLPLFFFTTVAHGQDVAEAARQEQARQATEAKTPRHVYTEEDLKQKKILTAEDQARVEARKKQSESAPAQLDAEQLPSNQDRQAESLGEVARRYRQQKAAREAELAIEKKILPFPYELHGSALADPKPGVAPAVRNSPGRVTPDPVPRAHVLPQRNAAPVRISPFEPRRLAAPDATPRVREPATRSVVPPLPAPVAPGALSRPSRHVPGTAANPKPLTGLLRVEVERGDSWWKLAKRYLGSGTRWQELRRANPEAVGPPELLRLGSVVLIPEPGIPPGRSGPTAATLSLRAP